jgi:cell division septation protein DedD
MARRNRSSRDKESAPGWVWMLFGLSLGLIVAIGVYLRPPTGAREAETRIEPAAGAAAERAAARTASRAADSGAERSEAAENRFEFYEILPQVEVVAPDDDPPASGGKRRLAETPGSYLLQAGSFSAAADADRMQANLALLGFASHVQRVTLDDNVFYRVRIGPIGDLETAKRAQRRLRDADIDTLVMQVPK